LSYATLLRNHDTAADLRRLSPEQIALAGPDDPKRDPVVKIDESHAFLEEHTGGPVYRTYNPSMKHANPCEDPQAARENIYEIYSRFGLATLQERRATISLHRPDPKVA
jgi:hypothetical protein